MIKAKIKLPYPELKDKKPEEPDMKKQELTLNYVTFAVTQKYKDGLESQFRRLWARVERKFDEAILADAETVDLELGEVDFIKRAVAEAKYPVSLSKFVVVFEDELENWKEAK